MSERVQLSLKKRQDRLNKLSLYAYSKVVSYWQDYRTGDVRLSNSIARPMTLKCCVQQSFHSMRNIPNVVANGCVLLTLRGAYNTNTSISAGARKSALEVETTPP